MNANKTIQVIARIAPPLLFGVAIYYGLKWIFSSDDVKKKPENSQRPIPTNSASAPIMFPPVSVPATPKSSAPAPSPAVPISEDLPPSPPLQKRRIVLREDLAQIFQHGARALYRINAVAELQNLGFGKTAAYEALSPDGKFTSWLEIAPDGVVSWRETESKHR